MIFGNTTNTTYRFTFKEYKLFYTVQKHEICPFMETVPYEYLHLSNDFIQFGNEVNFLLKFRRFFLFEILGLFGLIVKS